MGNLSKFSSGLAHEMVISADKAGFKPSEYYTLAQNRKLLGQVLGVVRGEAKIERIETLLDYGRAPRPPSSEYWIAKHNPYEYVKSVWDPNYRALGLYRSERGETGERFSKRAEGYGGALSATVYDFLIDDFSRVPETWKGKSVLFLGTTFYLPEDGAFYVRRLNVLDKLSIGLQRLDLELDDTYTPGFVGGW